MGKTKFESVDESSAGSQSETTAVAVKETGAVSTEVKVSGVTYRFAGLSPFYAVSAVPQECAKECHEGDLVLKTSKNSAWRLCGGGKANAIRAFVIDGKQGFLEGCPMGSGLVPRTWVVGRPKAAGSAETLATLDECRKAAMADTEGKIPFYRFEDYSKSMNPIPQHYISECLYLEMLVRLPEDFGGEVDLVKIGGGLYTPARVLFKKFDTIKVRQFFNNIKVREEMRHRDDENWKWSPYGQAVSFFTNGTEFTRPTGQKGFIWTPTVEAALGADGKLYKPDEEERKDLARFCQSMADTKVTAEDVAGAGQDGDL